jgi:hypothetical protein
MTPNIAIDYCSTLMEGWQHKLAFVIQVRTETDIHAGRFEGRIEHIKSSRATRFQCLDELVNFIAEVLAEVRDADRP